VQPLVRRGVPIGTLQFCDYAEEHHGQDLANANREGGGLAIKAKVGRRANHVVAARTCGLFLPGSTADSDRAGWGV
jgi:hypothetical protein